MPKGLPNIRNEKAFQHSEQCERLGDSASFSILGTGSPPWSESRVCSVMQREEGVHHSRTLGGWGMWGLWSSARSMTESTARKDNLFKREVEWGGVGTGVTWGVLQGSRLAGRQWWLLATWWLGLHSIPLLVQAAWLGEAHRRRPCHRE